MAAKEDALPPLSHCLELCLYVKNMEESKRFYKDVFGIEPFNSSPRSSGFALGDTVLLLFQQGLTAEDYVDDTGVIPGHGPSVDILQLLKGEDGQPAQKLKQHFCFAVQTIDQVKKYEERLKAKGIEITGIVNWARGGRSVYFADPDGHVGEVGSRGLWPNW